MPGTTQWAACDQGGECEVKADKWWVGTGAGKHLPGADVGTGAAEFTARAVHTTTWRKRDVSDDWSQFIWCFGTSSSCSLNFLSVADWLGCKTLILKT